MSRNQRRQRRGLAPVLPFVRTTMTVPDPVPTAAPPDPRLRTLLEQLGSLHAAETRRRVLLRAALRAARSQDLRRHIGDLGCVTVLQLERIEEAFLILGRPLDDLLAAPERTAGSEPAVAGPAATTARAILASLEPGGREVEAYGSACALARELGREDLVELLARSLCEHSRAAERLHRDGPGGDQSDARR